MKATCHLNGEENKSQARRGPPPSDTEQRKGDHAAAAGAMPTGGQALGRQRASGTVCTDRPPWPLPGATQRSEASHLLWQASSIPRTPGAIRTPAAQARRSRRRLRQVSPFTCVSAFPSGNNGPADRVLRCGLERPPDVLALHSRSDCSATESKDRAPACHTGPWPDW